MKSDGNREALLEIRQAILDGPGHSGDAKTRVSIAIGLVFNLQPKPGQPSSYPTVQVMRGRKKVGPYLVPQEGQGLPDLLRDLAAIAEGM